MMKIKALISNIILCIALLINTNTSHSRYNPGKDDLGIQIQVRSKPTDKICNPTFGTGTKATLVVYIDFYCHICAKEYENVLSLSQSPELKDVKIILKPIGALGSISYEAARYGLAFHAQGRFNEFARYMKEKGQHNEALTDLTPTLSTFENDINSDETHSLLARNSLEAKKIAQGDITPVFAVISSDGRTKKHVGYMAPTQIINLIKQTLAGKFD